MTPSVANESVLLFGGGSEERLVSVASAQNLQRQYAFTELWFIHPDGPVTSVTPAELQAHERAFELPFQPKAKALAESLTALLSASRNRVFFLALHGTEGEDGRLQSEFEKFKIAFTGSGAAASRTCFDKAKAKDVATKAGLAVAQQVKVQIRIDGLEQVTRNLSQFLKGHGQIVLKPTESGSSFGLHIVRSAEELATAISAMNESIYDVYLAEQFISGRELTVGVYQDVKTANILALPPSEVVLEQGFSFDYKGKYLGRGTKEITPADLTEVQKRQAQALAIQAHRALGCYGYSRTDMILTAKEPIFLETNTLPGLSKASFVPQQLTAAGIDMKSFIADQLQLAAQR